MAALKNLDKDHWAEEWSKIGLGYEAKGDAAAKAGDERQGARRALHARLRRLPGRPLSVAGLARQARRPISIRSACSARRRSISIRKLEIIEMPFEGKKLVGYLQKPPGVDQAARRHALGRRRRLEGRPPEDRQNRDGCGPRLAHHRHAGHRREPGAVRRSVRRAHVSAPGSTTCRRAPTSTASASRCGAAASAPTGRRGSPSPPPIASRARCSTAATCITASSANGSCRPSPPAARPICSARRACSMRAAAPWARRRRGVSRRRARRCRSRPWACSTRSRRRFSASTASSTTRRRSPTFIS